MKSTLLLISLCFACWAGVQAQAPATINFADLQAKLKANKAPLLVVNFWATWCKPCVAEMPHFQELAHNYAAKGVQVLFVSNDNPVQAATRVEAFLKKQNLPSSQVVVLDEPNPNTWISQINEQWSGAIPATLLVDAKGKYIAFHEGELDMARLQAFIQPYLQQP